MPVNIELTRPQTDDDFEVLCCALYQRVYQDPGLMRVGRSGQAQFGVDLLGVDRRTPSGISVGVQCKHYQAKRFTLRTVTDDVAEADKANLAIEHLTFATTAPASADVARQVHELTNQRRKQGKFTVSVDYWNAIEGHIRMHPDVGRAFIPGFPGGTLVKLGEDVGKLVEITAEVAASNRSDFEALKSGQHAIAREIRDLASAMTPVAGSLSPEPKGDEADPGVVASLNFVRDRVREGRTQDAKKLLEGLGNPDLLRDTFSRFRWHTNAAAIDLIEGRPEAAAAGFLRAFELARDDEKAHINRVQAYFLQRKFEAAEVACEEALTRFPSSGPLWGLRLHVRSELGKDPDVESVPAEVRDKPDYLFCLARIHGRRDDHATAVALLKRCIAGDGGSLDGRRLYLAEALMWADTKSVAAFLGQMAPERRTTLQDALDQFEPLEQTLPAIQSNDLSEELATNVTSSLMLLGKRARARSIATQLLARHPNLEQLLRIRFVELAETDDFAGLKAISDDRLDSLPPSTIALLAEASANRGDPSWNTKIQEVAARRAAEDVRLEEIAPLAAVAVWQQGNRPAALAQAQAYAAAKPTHVLGRVVAAQMLKWSNRVRESKREASAAAALLPANGRGPDVLQVADLLAELDMHVEAAALYERFIEEPRADELTIKWLQCLVSSDQRKKALLAIEKLPPDDRKKRTIRHIEVNLASRMMDWSRMRDLLEIDVSEGSLRPDVALGFGHALYRLGAVEQVRAFVLRDPQLKNATIEHELEFAKLQVAAGTGELGLQRLFRLFRKHPNNPKVAGILLAQVLVGGAVNSMNAPERVQSGSAVQLRAGSDTWWVAIDQEDGGADSWPELIDPSTPVAKQLLGAETGTRVSVRRGIANVEAEVVRLMSLFAYALDKAHTLISTAPASNGPVWSVRLIKDDGKIDIDLLRRQARERREEVEGTFSVYRDKRIPLGLLAQFLGTDPVSLRLDWPYRDNSLFIAIGTEDERQAALAAIRDSKRRFVVDLFTIAELLLHKTGDAVLRTVGPLLVPESQRQKLLALTQEVHPGKQVGSMQEVNGQLRILEFSDAFHRNRARFLESILAFVDTKCEVVATAGPESQSRELRELMRLLDDPTADCLLLCLERDAALLSEDGSLRMLAAQAGVTRSSGLQPVWMEAVERGSLSHAIYTSALGAKIVGNHDFVSINGSDLMELASRQPDKVHPAVRAALETFRRPTLVFSSGVKVCADFLRLAVRRLPPATTGKCAALSVSVLAHGRTIQESALKSAFAGRLAIFGRNGRSLPSHVRREFKGMLSRRHLRR